MLHTEIRYSRWKLDPYWENSQNFNSNQNQLVPTVQHSEHRSTCADSQTQLLLKSVMPKLAMWAELQPYMLTISAHCLAGLCLAFSYIEWVESTSTEPVHSAHGVPKVLEEKKTVAKVNIKVFSHPPDYICFTTAVELIELQSLGHMSACAGRSSCHSKHLHWKNANIVLLACSSSLLPWLHPQLVCWSLEGALQRAVCSCQRDPVPRQFSFSRKQALRIPYASSTFYLA